MKVRLKRETRREEGLKPTRRAVGRNKEALSHLPPLLWSRAIHDPKKRERERERRREGSWNKRVVRRTAAPVDAALLIVSWICGALWDQRVE